MRAFGCSAGNGQRGFTLVELIVVILLLAIVAIFSFRFVGIGAQMFADSRDRLSTLERSRFAVERLSRELRNSVPFSVRTVKPGGATFQCIEFVPIRVAGRYRRGPGGDTLRLLTFASGWTTATPDRLFIYATQANQIYSDLAERYVEPDPGQSHSGNLETAISYNGSFTTNSPRRRAFIGQQPVSYCVQGSRLYRYSDYGYQAAQPFPGGGLSGGVLMAEQLTNSAVNKEAFTVNLPTLQTNGLVTLYLAFSSQTGDDYFFNHEVNVPNVP